MDPLVQYLLDLSTYHPRSTIWIRTPSGSPAPRRGVALTEGHLREHLARPAGRVGLGFVAPGEDTCRAALIDIDDHGRELDPGAAIAAAREIATEARSRGLAPWACTSSSGRGAHVRFFWAEPQDAYSVREALRSVVRARGLREGSGGLARAEVEIFPKQSRVPPTGLGNMAWLPFSGESQPIDLESGEIVALDDVVVDPLPLSEPVPHVERPAPPAPPPAVDDAARERIESAVRAIPNPGRDYELFRDVGFALAHASGGAPWGRALLHEWARQSPLYDPELTDRKIFDFACRPDVERPITAEYLFAAARRHGWVDPRALDGMEPIGYDASAGAPGAELGHDNQGDDVGEGAQASAAPGRPAPPTALRASRVSEVATRPAMRWIVRDVLPEAELAVLYGAPGSGKSFVALDLAFAIARGEKWCGKAVRKGRVAYVAAEGVTGVAQRVRAYCRKRSIEPESLDDVVIIDGHVALGDRTSVVDLVQTTRNAFGGGRPKVDVVIIDTLARASAGLNENSGEDMGLVIKHCTEIHKALGAVVVLVHHVGKDADRGARGWSGILGACDAELLVSVERDERLIEVTKMKDGEDNFRAKFALERVTIGVEDDGEGGMREVSSAVVKFSDDDESERKAKSERENRVRERARAVKALGASQRELLSLIESKFADAPVSDVIEHYVSVVHADETSATQKRRERWNLRRAIMALDARGLVRLELDDGGQQRVRLTTGLGAAGLAEGGLTGPPKAALRDPVARPVENAEDLLGPDDGGPEGALCGAAIPLDDGGLL